MPQPRAPKVDWLLEAWNLSTTLVDVPTRPLKIPGLGQVPLDASVESYLVGLQTRLNAFLNYCVAIKLGAGKAKTLPRFDSDDSRHLTTTRNALKKAGMDFDERATAAIFVHAQIGFVQQHRHLDDANRITLPVTLAAIAGKSAALTNAINASRQRNVDRRSRPTLRDAKLDAKSRCPGASWKELLVDLTGEDIVVAWDDKTIEWRADDDTVKTISVSTFQKYK